LRGIILELQSQEVAVLNQLALIVEELDLQDLATSIQKKSAFVDLFFSFL
jgi:hypothetical protein